MNNVLKETADNLRTERLELQAKIREMKAAEDAIRELLGADGDATTKKSTPSRITVAEKIKAVLSEHPRGLDVNDLTTAVGRNYNELAQKSTIQSQLSRMFKDDTVQNHEGKWRLSPVTGERVKEFFASKGRAKLQATEPEKPSHYGGQSFDLDDDVPF